MQFPTIFLLLLGALLVAVALTTRFRFSLGPLLVCGALGILGLSVVKFIPFAAIALSSWVASWWAEVKDTPVEKPGLFEGLLKSRNWCEALSPPLLSGIAFLSLCITIVEINKLIKTPLEEAMVPEKALDFMIKNNLPHPWLNEFGMGGYVMYRVSDEHGNPNFTVPIDGRTNVNPKEIWDLHSAALKGKENWRDYINKVGAKTILWREGSSFTTLLKESREWCMVYPESFDSDRTFMVWVKNGESSIPCATPNAQ